jgi:hypothetical protein
MLSDAFTFLSLVVTAKEPKRFATILKFGANAKGGFIHKKTCIWERRRASNFGAVSPL